MTKLGLQAMWAARRSGDPDDVWRVLERASPLLRASLFGAGTKMTSTSFSARFQRSFALYRAARAVRCVLLGHRMLTVL